MSYYRLLVDWEVIEKLNRLPLRARRNLRKALSKIVAAPDSAADYEETNLRGIPLQVHLCDGYALKYWIDFPDRHIKVLDLDDADFV